MRNFEQIKALVGEEVTKEDLQYVDCYVQGKFGLFIPSLGACGYASRLQHRHPSYMFTLIFQEEERSQPPIPIKENQYLGMAVSPDVPHNDLESIHYYCILIDRQYFEERYKLYEENVPHFSQKYFGICHDVLHALNTFIFEYSKNMKNANITLEAQANILTHWLIRSIIGETYDMRSVSTNYSVARAQQYMEIHYQDKILVEDLAKLGNLSVSGFNRIFKREIGETPMEYLSALRLGQSKKLLRRKEVPITEIALRCGFNSSAHFSASFRKYYGVTPSEYRKKYI